MASKEMKVIRRRLEAQGWTIEPLNKAYDYAVAPTTFDASSNYPTGARIPRGVKLPSTPAGVRWKQNLVAELKRRGGYRDED